MKGRKIYGTFYKGIYHACATIHEDDNPAAIGLGTETIPGGKYVSRKLDDWPQHIKEIGPWFMDMTKKVDWDENRPSIEYYRSMKELIMYLPVK